MPLGPGQLREWAPSPKWISYPSCYLPDLPLALPFLCSLVGFSIWALCRSSLPVTLPCPSSCHSILLVLNSETPPLPVSEDTSVSAQAKYTRRAEVMSPSFGGSRTSFSVRHTVTCLMHLLQGFEAQVMCVSFISGWRSHIFQLCWLSSEQQPTGRGMGHRVLMLQTLWF